MSIFDHHFSSASLFSKWQQEFSLSSVSSLFIHKQIANPLSCTVALVDPKNQLSIKSTFGHAVKPIFGGLLNLLVSSQPNKHVIYHVGLSDLKNLDAYSRGFELHEVPQNFWLGVSTGQCFRWQDLRFRGLMAITPFAPSSLFRAQFLRQNAVESQVVNVHLKIDDIANPDFTGSNCMHQFYIDQNKTVVGMGAEQLDSKTTQCFTSFTSSWGSHGRFGVKLATPLINNKVSTATGFAEFKDCFKMQGLDLGAKWTLPSSDVVLSSKYSESVGQIGLNVKFSPSLPDYKTQVGLSVCWTDD